jgi:hypothetical protein
MLKIRRDRNANTAAMKNKGNNKIKENRIFQSKYIIPYQYK